MLEDMFGPALGDLITPEVLKEAARMEHRRLAGIPSLADGPWDEALDITAQAEKVAKTYRDLAAS